MLRRLALGLLARRMSNDLAAIRQALVRQNELLLRLAEHFAPTAPPPADRARLTAETGLSYLDPIEMGLSLDYIQRTHAATGHMPDEEEILVYLADEKTHDLHQRLADREAEMARLTRVRAEDR